MKAKFYFLISLAASFIAAFGAGEIKQAVKDERPVEKTESAYTKALYGIWKYDMPFMGNEITRLKQGFIAIAKRSNKNFKHTPQIDQALDDLLHKLIKIDSWSRFRVEFLPGGKIKVRASREANEPIDESDFTLGFSPDLSTLYFQKMVEIDGKKQMGVVDSFEGLRLTQNSILREEEIKPPFGDSTLIVRHRYIRQ